VALASRCVSLDSGSDDKMRGEKLDKLRGEKLDKLGARSWTSCGADGHGEERFWGVSVEWCHLVGHPPAFAVCGRAACLSYVYVYVYPGVYMYMYMYMCVGEPHVCHLCCGS